MTYMSLQQKHQIGVQEDHQAAKHFKSICLFYDLRTFQHSFAQKVCLLKAMEEHFESK